MAGVSRSASAHHSFGMFEMQKNITVKGTVQDFQWTNPHIWIDLVVVDPVSNKQVLWSIEGGATAGQTGAGWTRHSLKPGDVAELVVHPLRSGAIGGSLVSGKANGVPIGHLQVWPK